MQQYIVVHDDAFDWLARRRPSSVHAIVTDPPYTVLDYRADQLRKRSAGAGGTWRLPQSYDRFKRIPMPRFTELTRADLKTIALFHGRLSKALHRVLVPGAHVIMASQNLLAHLAIAAFIESGFELRGQIARVVKTLRGGDRPKGAHEEFPGTSVTPRSCWEPWLVFRKPMVGRVSDTLERWGTGALRRPSPDKPCIDLVVAPPPRGRERAIARHPTLKPQSLMRQLVWASLPLGRGVIVDPFMGSGSTIAAASALGLRSIGVEKRGEYYRRAVKAVPKLAALEVEFTPIPVPVRNAATVRQVTPGRSAEQRQPTRRTA